MFKIYLCVKIFLIWSNDENDNGYKINKNGSKTTNTNYIINMP